MKNPQIFTMTLDEDEGVFQIDMHDCPSKGRLNQISHITPYKKLLQALRYPVSPGSGTLRLSMNFNALKAAKRTAF